MVATTATGDAARKPGDQRECAGFKRPKRPWMRHPQTVYHANDRKTMTKLTFTAPVSIKAKAADGKGLEKGTIVMQPAYGGGLMYLNGCRRVCVPLAKKTGSRARQAGWGPT